MNASTKTKAKQWLLSPVIAIGLFSLLGIYFGYAGWHQLFIVDSIAIFLLVIATTLRLRQVNESNAKSYQNISEHSKNHQDSERKVSLIFENIGDGLININEEGVIESVNTATTKIFGYTKDEVVGKNITMLMPKKYRPLHDVGLKRYLAGGEAHVIGKGSVELEGLHSTGTIFPLELSITKFQIGAKRYFTGIIRDITLKKRTEEITQLASIVENAREAIIGLDANLKVLSWNRAAERMYGYQPYEILGQSILESIPEAYHDKFMELTNSIREEYSSHQIDIERIRKDGSLLPVSIVLSPFKSIKNEFLGISSIESDISERKRIESIKNEFISMVSHELRTPLTAIKGSLGLLLGEVVGKLPIEIHKLIEIAESNCDRLVRLINDILDIEKIEMGKMEFSLYPHNLKRIIEEAYRQNLSFAIKYNVNLKIEDFADSLYVSADADKLHQVLTNLISNAVKFSPANSTVTLRAMPKNKGKVRIEISDQGMGIDENFKDKIFQKFAQADSSSSRHFKGTGLGLSITKAIIEKMGGTIDFQANEDKGTTFYFELDAIAAIKEETSPAESQSKEILIFTANPEVCQSFNDLLIADQFHPEIVHSTQELEQQLMSNKIDAVIVDLNMPDSLQTINLIKRYENGKKLPVIVISFGEESNSEIIGSDAFVLIDWINRPLDPEQLKESIHNLLAYFKNETPHILHVEDDLSLTHIISKLLEKNATVKSVGTVEAARKKLNDETFDLVILDIMLPDGFGIELLPQLSQARVPVIVFSSYELPKDYNKYIVTHLVKSKTSNHELLQVIKRAINTHQGSIQLS